MFGARFTRVLLCQTFLCVAANFSTTNLVSVQARLAELKTLAQTHASADASVAERFQTLINIFSDDAITASIQPYKLDAIMARLGASECTNNDFCLTELLQTTPIAPVIGFRGNPTGYANIHSVLNQIAKYVMESAVQNTIGAPSDTSIINGISLWSRFNWVLEQVQGVTNAGEQEAYQKVLGLKDDDSSTDPYTVSALWKLIQRCIEGTVCLIDAELIKNLIESRTESNVTGGLAKLDLDLNSLCDAFDKDKDTTVIQAAAAQLLTTSTGLYQMLANRVTDTVTIASPDPSVSALIPGILLSQATAAIGLVPSAPVELTEIVRQSLYQWPRLMSESLGGSDAIRAIYVGNNVLSGVTLINTLHNVQRAVYLDPILRKLGRNLSAPSTTVLGKIKAICDSSDALPGDFKVNTVMLLYKLLDTYPVIGELEQSASTPFYTYLNEKVGNISTGSGTLFGTLSDSSTFAAIVDDIKVTLDSMVAKLYASGDDTKQTATSTLLANFEWVNYHTLFASLINGSEPDSTLLYRELFSTPLTFMMSGIPYMTEVSSLVDLMGGTAEEKAATWMALEGQSTHASFNFMRKFIDNSSLLFFEKPALVTLIADIIKGLSSISDSLYNQLTAPLYAELEAFAQDTDPVEGSLVSKFSGDSPAKDIVYEIARLISTSRTNRYPIDFSRIYFLLKQVNDVPTEEVANSLGYSQNDHPLDVTIYGRLNGVLFEFGAQLLLNFIGSQSDPLNAPYPTYFSRLCAAERVSIASNPDLKEKIQENAESIRRKLFDVLTGAISYYYKQCIPGATDSKFASLAASIAAPYEAGSLILATLDTTVGTVVPRVASMIESLTGTPPSLS
ncbi:MAG: hypothetical protein LBF66_02730 [Holosporales bacterium]|jgi:hypothetical protein|nr:hypothetical protein [Holosporales bacterium]